MGLTSLSCLISGSQPSQCHDPLIVPHVVLTPNNEIIFIATS